jgi:hypothetical protein
MASRLPPRSHPKPQAEGRGQRPNVQIAGQKSFANIHPKDLPIIELNSGATISYVRDAIQYHFQKELGEISAIFTEGRYKTPATTVFSSAEIEADVTGILRQQAIAKAKRIDADNDHYEKSKLKLHGILSTMTTREVDERGTAHREQNLAATTTSAVATTTEITIAAIPTVHNPLEANNNDIFCPLALWRNIIHVLTTRTNGNRKADLNTVAINFANLKQRTGETVADFKRRTLTILDSYDALELIRPRDIDIASRFLYGLEDCRYAAIKLYLGNESANGRDLYPSDLDAAAAQASRWLAAAPRSNEYYPTTATTFIASYVHHQQNS